MAHQLRFFGQLFNGFVLFVQQLFQRPALLAEGLDQSEIGFRIAREPLIEAVVVVAGHLGRGHDHFVFGVQRLLAAVHVADGRVPCAVDDPPVGGAAAAITSPGANHRRSRVRRTRRPGRRRENKTTDRRRPEDGRVKRVFPSQHVRSRRETSRRRSPLFPRINGDRYRNAVRRSKSAFGASTDRDGGLGRSEKRSARLARRYAVGTAAQTFGNRIFEQSEPKS